jgi:hypothetical protein
MVIRDITPLVNSGNNWITLSIMVAASVRLQQDPPVFEIDFMTLLLAFQLLMALARTASTCTFAGRLDHTDRRLTFSSVWFAFLLVFNFALLISAGYSVSKEKKSAMAGIAHFCAFENDLSIPLYVHADTPAKPDLEWWQALLLSVGSPLLSVGLVVVGIVALGVIILAFWIICDTGCCNLWLMRSDCRPSPA